MLKSMSPINNDHDLCMLKLTSVCWSQCLQSKKLSVYILKPIFAIHFFYLYTCWSQCLQSGKLSVYMLKPMSAIRDTFPLLVRLCSTCMDQQGITGRLTTGMSYLVAFSKKNIQSIPKTILNTIWSKDRSLYSLEQLPPSLLDENATLNDGLGEGVSYRWTLKHNQTQTKLT